MLAWIRGPKNVCAAWERSPICGIFEITQQGPPVKTMSLLVSLVFDLHFDLIKLVSFGSEPDSSNQTLFTTPAINQASEQVGLSYGSNW